jgi:ring-1,2-phenylacetyl-CoA epoxidase subunit PaaE
MEKYIVKVKEIIRETADAVVVELDIPKEIEDRFKFLAGQYITLSTIINGNKVNRMYSLCSTPRSGQIKVGIKKIPNGVFSTYANDVLKVGDELTVFIPQGKFSVTCRSNNQKKYALIAAGSGITPILSMLKTILSEEPFSEIDLFYGNKTLESTMFKAEIDKFAGIYPNRLKTHYIFSQDHSSVHHGRIHGKWIVDILQNKVSEINDFFICGPAEMIYEVRDYLNATVQVDTDKIHYELFTTGKKAKENAVTEDENFDVAKLKIVVDGRTYNLEVAKHEKILDIILDKGIDVRHSCKGGLCTQCVAKIKHGKVEMLQNIGLSGEEIQQGLVLTCQGVPLTSEVFLNFDFEW